MFLAEVTLPKSQTAEPFFWLKTGLESRTSSVSLEQLVAFLAYQVPKLWPKKQNR